jgi:hypothetical protein
MPPLRDANEPLLDAVRTLLTVNAEGDRRRRVAVLIEGFKKTSGAGAVALFRSLTRRSCLSQSFGTSPAISNLLMSVLLAAIIGPSRRVVIPLGNPASTSLNVVLVTDSPTVLKHAIRHLMFPLEKAIEAAGRKAGLQSPDRSQEALTQLRLEFLHAEDVIDGVAPPPGSPQSEILWEVDYNPATATARHSSASSSSSSSAIATAPTTFPTTTPATSPSTPTSASCPSTSSPMRRTKRSRTSTTSPLPSW